MNVLIITSRADIGGGPRHVMDLLTENSRRQFPVRYHVSAPEKQFFTNLFKTKSSGFIPIPFRSFNLLSFLELLIYCKKKQIDLIHSHGRGAGFYSRLLRIFGYRVVHTFHGIHLEPGLRGRVKTTVDIFMSAFTNRFISVSPSEKAHAEKYLFVEKKKIFLIENGVDLNDLTYQRMDQRESLSKVGIIARFSYAKGLDLFISAVLHLRRYYPEQSRKIKFLIAGDGELWNQINESINFHGLQKHIELLGNIESFEYFWERIDLLVSFSRWEGMPLSVLEAYRARVPCLLSNVSGNCDLAQEGEALLFDPESAEDFCRKLFSIETSFKTWAEKKTHKAYSRLILKNNTQQMFSETLSCYNFKAKTS